MSEIEKTTPGPWHQNGIAVEGDSGSRFKPVICDCFGSIEQAEANAALIVKAVNGFDELKAAIAKTIGELYAAALADISTPDAHGVSFGGIDIQSFRRGYAEGCKDMAGNVAAAIGEDFKPLVLAAFEEARSSLGDGDAIKWGVRRIGSDYKLTCFVSGASLDLMPNVSGFVGSKEEGEKLVAMFGGRARLDFRPSEPNWIQVKVGVIPEHMAALERLYAAVRANGNMITRAMIQESRSSLGEARVSEAEGER
jgi:hypothetical protein